MFHAAGSRCSVLCMYVCLCISGLQGLGAMCNVQCPYWVWSRFGVSLQKMVTETGESGFASWLPPESEYNILATVNTYRRCANAALLSL